MPKVKATVEGADFLDGADESGHLDPALYPGLNIPGGDMAEPEPEQPGDNLDNKQNAQPASPYEALAKLPGAPTKEQVELWKQQYNGDVLASILGANEIYIFRAINRLEWKNYQTQLSSKKLSEDGMRELIVRNCVLWPNLGSPEIAAVLKAGTMPTLYEQVMFYSNFIDPSLAVQMVYEL